MTIGIAASGPGAGLAILRGLEAAEKVGRGALGGFVSFAAIADGAVHRAETQVGGAGGLFGGAPMPEPLAGAPLAVLMSSGPNRPEPLSQFTPADAAVGLVTGHRFPNVAGARGRALNLEVLDRMRAGEGVRRAVEAVAADNPDADAGLLAVGLDGGMFGADTRYLAEFGDAGATLVECAAQGIRIAVRHNGIRPYRVLAALVAEVAQDSMTADAERPSARIRIAAGIGVEPGEVRALHLDAQGRALRITLPPCHIRQERWSFGIGYRVRVLRQGAEIGRLLYEPYMVAERGRLVSIDGAAEIEIPMLGRR